MHWGRVHTRINTRCVRDYVCLREKEREPRERGRECVCAREKDCVRELDRSAKAVVVTYAF